MKQYLFVSLLIFCLVSVNVFALNDFVQEQENHHHAFCSLFAHEHTHMHHGVQHSHDHVHKVDLVDFKSIDTESVLTFKRDSDRPNSLKQWHIESYPTKLFRPPIS